MTTPPLTLIRKVHRRMPKNWLVFAYLLVVSTLTLYVTYLINGKIP